MTTAAEKKAHKGAGDGQAREREAKIPFASGALRKVGDGLWIYRHDAELAPEDVPPGFWNEAKRNWGMRAGDVVVLTMNRKAVLTVA